MVGGNDYPAVDTVFPFKAWFIDLATGFVEQALTTSSYIIYSYLNNSLTWYRTGDMADELLVREI